VFLAWSAAASSGEEAHSLAVICQAFKEVTAGFEYKITGTDISGEMINRCKKGDYSGRALEYFQKNKTECFKKYMKSAEGESFRALSEIRNHLHFEQHNLFYPSRLASKFDLILVRNVLIYFCPSDQETVLSLLAPKLKDAGVS
jgi:chemotaxis protein methyltransferase CheR